MAKVHAVGEAIELKFGAHHDVLIDTLVLPAPPIKPGTKGERVKVLEEALVRIGYLPKDKVTSSYDRNLAHALQRFQKDWKVVAHDEYDAATQAALKKALAGEKPPDSGHKGPPHKPPPPRHPPPHHTPGASVRERIVANAEWGIRNEPAIHYAEIRPIPDLDRPHHLPITTDCSGFATLCYKWAGAPDPNGTGYDGQGYTGTMLQHMRHIPQSQAQPGDLVVFGGGTGNHVCVLLEAGTAGGHNPWLASHGSESGPGRIRFADEYQWQRTNQGDGVTWLTVLDGAHAAADHPAAHAAGGHPAGHAAGHPAPHQPAAHHPEHKPAPHHADPKPAPHHADPKPAPHHADPKPAPHHADQKPAPAHKPPAKRHK